MTGIPPNILVQSHLDVQGILDRLGITTQSPFELIPAVLPTIAFERPTPSTEQPAWARQTIVGVAAQFSHCGLFNPAGSGKLIHVDSVIISASATAEAIIGAADTAFTTPSTLKDFRDRRVPGSPSGVPAGQATAAVHNGEMLTTLPDADVSQILPIDAFIGEGQGVGIRLTIANVTLRAGWFWEEGPPAEL